jgi:hypothetical protein
MPGFRDQDFSLGLEKKKDEGKTYALDWLIHIRGKAFPQNQSSSFL